MNNVKFFKGKGHFGVDFEFSEIIFGQSTLVITGSLHPASGLINNARLDLIEPSYYEEDGTVTKPNSFTIFGWDNIITFLSHFTYGCISINEFIQEAKKTTNVEPMLTKRRTITL